MREERNAQHVFFVANFELTKTYRAVERWLERHAGVRATWIVYSERWRRWLIKDGVSPRDVISVIPPRSQVAPGIVPGLPGFECNRPDEPSLLEAIEADRVLRGRPLDESLRLLAGAIEIFTSAVRDRGPVAIFGEATLAAEIALVYAARWAGVPYLTPASVRYPVGRFGFFESPSQQRLLPLRDSLERSESEEVELCLESVRSKEGVSLWAENAVDVGRFLRMPNLMLEKMWLGMTDAGRNPTQLRFREYASTRNPIGLRRRVAQARDAARMGSASPSNCTDPFILFALGVQPESSIDVFAWRARDQLADIRALRGALDPDILIGVKEHTHQFGSRDPAFYDQVCRIPGVFLIDPFSSSREWADAAQLVVSVTGTMSYERGLRNEPAAVMAPIYFDRLPTVARLSPRSLGRDLMHALQPVASERDVTRFLGQVIRSSSPGLITDPRTNSLVLADENVASLGRGFMVLLSRISRRH